MAWYWPDDAVALLSANGLVGTGFASQYRPNPEQVFKGPMDRCTVTTPSSLGERERNILFNDALNTFYLQLCGIRHMVKDHSDSEKGNLLPPHRLLLSINSKGSFICTIPQTG